MINIFSKIFKRKNMNNFSFQDEIDNLEFLLRIENSSRLNYEECNYINILENLYKRINNFEEFFDNKVFISITNLEETLISLNLDTLKDTILNENKIRDEIIDKLRENKIIDSELLSNSDICFKKEVENYLGIGKYSYEYPKVVLQGFYYSNLYKYSEITANSYFSFSEDNENNINSLKNYKDSLVCY